MFKRNRGFTLVETLVVSAVLVGLFLAVNAIYVGSAKQSRSADEHSTAADSATRALEFILSDLRQMAVRPKPEPLTETFRLSRDRRSIAFLRSEPGSQGTTEGGAISVVTFQVGVSPRGTGNYILERVREKEGCATESHVMPSIVLRDLDYEPIQDGTRYFIRVSVTALSRDDDVRLAEPDYAPKTYSASSLFEVLRPESKARFADGLPTVNPLAAITPGAMGAPAGSVTTSAGSNPPIGQPHDVPPPPPMRERVAGATPTTTDSTGAGDGTTGADGEPGADGTGATTAPTGGTPGTRPNPWVATGVRPNLRDPIQKLLDTIREDNGDDFRGKVRGFVYGRYEDSNRGTSLRSGEFSEGYVIDFTGKGNVDPARQIERILERLARVSASALGQFLRQHGVLDADPDSISQSLNGGNSNPPEEPPVPVSQLRGR